MAGTLTISTIKSDNALPPTFQNTSGTEVGQLCRAWVNFNGVTTATIRASFNVSSVTRNASGDYTVNFTTAMVDANYAPMFGGPTATDNTKGGVCLQGGYNSAPTLKTTTQMRIATGQTTGTAAADFQEIYACVFR